MSQDIKSFVFTGSNLAHLAIKMPALNKCSRSVFNLMKYGSQSGQFCSANLACTRARSFSSFSKNQRTQNKYEKSSALLQASNGCSKKIPSQQSRSLTLSHCNCLTCKELIMEEYGEPQNVVKQRSVELPALKPEEVLVRMLAAPINPSDINTIQGMYAVKPDLPCILGNEGLAEVVEVGPNAGDFLKVGDWVIPGYNQWGTWRSHAMAEPSDFIKLPNDMDRAAAATLSVNPTTAYRMLKDFVTLQPGDTVIQNAANSAVGRAVIQLCAHYGYKSINVVRDRPTIAELKKDLTDLGADVVVTERELRTDRRIRQLEKPALALNCVSGKSATELLRLIQDGGVLVTYGGMARQPVTVPVGSLIFNDVRLMGYWQTRWSLNPDNQTAKQQMFDDLCDLVKQGKISAPPYKMVNFDNYMTAIKDAMPAEGQVGAKQILAFD